MRATDMRLLLAVGDYVYGFCNGWFGRDFFDKGRVEAVGRDWVVVREDDGGPVFASCYDSMPDVADVLRWKDPDSLEEEDE